MIKIPLFPEIFGRKVFLKNLIFCVIKKQNTPFKFSFRLHFYILQTVLLLVSLCFQIFRVVHKKWDFHTRPYTILVRWFKDSILTSAFMLRSSCDLLNDLVKYKRVMTREIPYSRLWSLHLFLKNCKKTVSCIQSG